MPGRKPPLGGRCAICQTLISHEEGHPECAAQVLAAEPVGIASSLTYYPPPNLGERIEPYRASGGCEEEPDESR